MEALLQTQRAAFEQEGPVGAETRIDRLTRAIALLFDNQQSIAEAIDQDFGNRSHHQTLIADIYASMESLKYSKRHVRRWMKPHKRKVPMPLPLVGAKAWVEYCPKGVVGILGTWNFPINTVFSPLAGVLAAGNSAMLKFSEVAPTTAALMAQLVANHFDASEMACVSGGPEVGAAFSSLPLCLLYTSPSPRD